MHATLDPVGAVAVDQGTNIQLRIASDQDANVLIVMVNPKDQAKIIVLNCGAAGDRIAPGQPTLFPDLSYGEKLYAAMDVGKATIYVVASDGPILNSEQAKEPPLSNSSSRRMSLSSSTTSARAVYAQCGFPVVIKRIDGSDADTAK